MKQTQLIKGIGNSFLFGLVLLVVAFALTAICTHAQTAKPWVAPVTANQLKNPVAENDGALKEAKKLYITYCSPCHGNSGKGDGIAAAALSPKPADHTSIVVQKETDGSLYWKMTEGRANMPPYKQTLSENQRWGLVNYIRTLAKHKQEHE